MKAISLGPLVFPTSYVLVIVASIIVFAVARRFARQSSAEIERPLWIILLFGLITARIAFAAVYNQHYQTIWTVIDIRDGGFSMIAGVAGAIFMTVVFAMRDRLLFKPLVASILSGAVILGAGTALLATAEEKQGLPEVTLASIEGLPVQVQSLGGKPMVVNLWATWCPPCRREMPVLRDAQQANQDIVFVFANQGESAETVQSYLAAEKLALQNVLLDAQGTLPRKIGSIAMPTTLFFDKDGKLVDTRVGEVSAATLEQRMTALRAAK